MPVIVPQDILIDQRALDMRGQDKETQLTQERQAPSNTVEGNQAGLFWGTVQEGLL